MDKRPSRRLDAPDLAPLEDELNRREPIEASAQRTKNNEPRTKNQEQRTTNQELFLKQPS